MSRIELKIDGQTTGSVSYNISAGKDIPATKPADILIAHELADDAKDVCGFGQPISPALVNDIAGSYFTKSERAWDLLEDVVNGKIQSIAELIQHSSFSDLRELLNPENQIVSGVFGKEIILDIIGRKDCEGIRYIIGEMEGKMTVVLLGVKDITKPGDSDPKSEPLAGANHYKQARGRVGYFNTKVPPDTEVHKQSLTRQQVIDKLGIGAVDKRFDNDSIADVLLGEY